jgi:hypothetical protein
VGVGPGHGIVGIDDVASLAGAGGGGSSADALVTNRDVVATIATATVTDHLPRPRRIGGIVALSCRLCTTERRSPATG